jgi:hypothetical protein
MPTSRTTRARNVTCVIAVGEHDDRGGFDSDLIHGYTVDR